MPCKFVELTFAIASRQLWGGPMAAKFDSPHSPLSGGAGEQPGTGRHQRLEQLAPGPLAPRAPHAPQYPPGCNPPHPSCILISRNLFTN